MDWLLRILEIVGSLILSILKMVLTVVIYILGQFCNFIQCLPEGVGIPIYNHLRRGCADLRSKWQGRKRNVRTTNFCPKIVADFERLAGSLAPDTKYLVAGRKVQDDIIKELRGWRTDYKVARTKIAGSVGKNTAISYVDSRTNQKKNPDFDIVVFINNAEPPFDAILRRFKTIIEGIEGVKRPVKISNISVQFTFQHPVVGNIDFDLLPAQNHVPRRLPFQNVGEEEARRALEDVRQRHLENIRNQYQVNTDDNKIHSSSFCEKTVSIVGERMKHSFYLKMVRLAKYWNKCVEINEYVPARSYMIELIAIHSQKGKPKRCPIGGFKRFLTSMANLKNLFVQVGADDTAAEEKEELRVIRELFLEEYRTPIILDLANPYNNVAHGISESAVKIFSAQARKTLNMLERLKSTSDYERVESSIEETIFAHKN